MPEEEQPQRALAHYLWPPQWVGAPPPWAEQGRVPLNPDELGDLIVEVELPGKTKARVFRDGEIVFTLGPEEPAYYNAFMEWQETCVRLMNAHLACLSASIPSPGLLWTSVATPWSSLQVDFEDGRFRAASTGNSAGTALESHEARRALSSAFDWRLRRGPLVAIREEWVRTSFDLLQSLLARPVREGHESGLLQKPALLRAELLQRSKTALLDSDYTGALTNAWIARRACSETC